MSVNVSKDRTSGGGATRTLLLGGVGLLAIGAVVAQAASVSSRRPGVSAFISTSLAALIAAKAPAPAPAPTPTPAATAAGTNPFKLGINSAGIEFYNNDRPFMNLIYGSVWQLNRAGGTYRTMPSEYLDANGWVKNLPAGGEAIKFLNHPIVPAGGLDIVCRYQGNGRLNVSGVVSNIAFSRGETRFRLDSRYPERANLAIYYETIDTSDPIRNIDCREADANPNQVYSDHFLEMTRNFGISRFMCWQIINSSNRVTWATRNRPGNGDYLINDGVPMELLVQLAEETGVDPWFNMSWNASEDYIRGFATYVRDHVSPGKKIYVETSNEVWNAMFAASRQAEQEGLARGFGPDPFAAKLKRYGERSAEVFRIWSDVFQGQMHRIVRVVNTQHVNPWTAEMVLSHADTRNWVDALATAPYFGYHIASSGSPNYDAMFTQLRSEIPETINHALANKRLAAQFGKSYLSYEAGHHMIMQNDVRANVGMNRDNRMEGVYRDYIAAWRTQVGGPLMMFVDVTPTTVWGAWGLLEHAGQPLSEAPKMRAVMASRP